ncbi:MAG TPA: EcsC family protein, partial [Lacibacter sp.]|nr:EcsC family protein [Lacibacter sp.]
MLTNDKTYNSAAQHEMKAWQRQMLKKPSLLNSLSKGVQTKINSWIPEKIHVAITATIKQLIKAVVFGTKLTTAKPLANASLQEREIAIEKKIDNYKKTAAVEGGIAGAGGILLG